MWRTERIIRVEQELKKLLAARDIAFDEKLRSNLTTSHGVYAIRKKDAPPGSYLRAGATKQAQDGLQQRVYRNHFQGTQSGNLRQQLVKAGICDDLNSTKDWIRANCLVQCLPIPDARLRSLAEHYMLAVLQPEFSDYFSLRNEDVESPF